MESLDGNGQLFLCLQDLTMDQFRNKLVNRNNASLIIVSDDEWDLGTVLLCYINYVNINYVSWINVT